MLSSLVGGGGIPPEFIFKFGGAHMRNRNRSRKIGVLLGLAFGITIIAVGVLPAFSAPQDASQTPPAKSGGSATMPWTPEDLINAETASGFRISPDGKWTVWSKSVANKEKDGRVSNLFLSSLTEKKEVQLTRGTDTNGNAVWSPKGDLIAFSSTKPLPDAKPGMSKSQIWLINPFGGEPWPMTTFERGVNRFEWITDDVIIFSAEEDATLFEKDTEQRKDDSRVIDDEAHAAPVRLFKLSVKDKKVTRLTTNNDRIQNWAVTKDLSHVVTVHNRELSYAWDQKIAPATFVWDLRTSQSKQIFTDGKIRPNGVSWTLDGTGFYVTAPYSSDARFFTATIELLYFYDFASGETHKVDIDWENGLAGGIDVTPDGFVAFLAAGTKRAPARYTMGGSGTSRKWTRAMIEGDHTNNIGGLSISEDGKRVAYNYSTASIPGQWFGATLDGTRITGQLQLTNLNPSYAKKEIAKSEVVHWKGANGDDVDGIVFYPLHYEAGKRYPLVLGIHGGPAGSDLDLWSESWAYPTQLYTERGAFVLKVNYHGSNNHGLKFVESICCGHYYDLEIPDIENGVDALIQQGKVDPDRIGTAGWSNGSILSIELTIKNPARYKAAMCGAGDVEWISDWANVDFGESFDSYYFGKSPLEDPELYIKKSPIFQMDKVRTPTLIFFGTNDRQVPTEEGWTHYRTLYTINKAPVRFILFPGEAHGPTKLSHQLRKVNEEMTWMDRYLFKTEVPANEAFKKDSPLGEAMRRRSIARDGTRYGNLIKVMGTGPVLAPEVVKRGNLEIGRFEVTRAQYATFDHTYKIDPGTENYPANGITFEKGKAFAAWLSTMTHEQWRVPNEDEVASLYNNRAGENTLDYWAGYAPNPDDADRLMKQIAQLPGDAPLLREVGSFHGQGDKDDELIFDLGGNVAEWVIAADGSGKTLGGSADRPADNKAAYQPASLPYTGFRVVRGAPQPKK
jgi:dipeptidyl aminopeptidase/acylaminoacyl peptidase